MGNQNYGMFSTPTMKDIADANHFAFSPNPWFIAAFFSGQVVLQLVWIRKLFRIGPDGYSSIDSSAPTQALNGNAEGIPNDDEKTALSYVLIYALGNLCVAGWLFFWLRQDFTESQVLVTINTVAQLLAVARLPPLTAQSSGLMRLTHLVAKTFAGIGVLDLVDNGGVMMRYRAPPSTLIQALTYALFPIAAASSSPFFGSILLYDVLAVFVGQRSVPGAGEWGTCLGWTALAMGGIVSFKGLSAWRRA
ncbi:hypothetical protein AcV5_005235 [Taiwanofungus camphoratus]|nr:hypothetical protein AcV5_005235 [Antrodia cinnamomea]KAI0962503.1 hypothetical protein AcV7_001336 [Antrodia cinnamomea]